MPEAQTLFEATAKTNHLVALREAKKFFEGKLWTILSDPQSEDLENFRASFEALRQETVKIFESIPKIGREEFSEHYLRVLKETMDHSFEEFTEYLEGKKRRQQENSWEKLRTSILLTAAISLGLVAGGGTIAIITRGLVGEVIARCFAIALSRIRML